MKKLDRKTAVALSLFFALLTAYVWNVSTNRRLASAEAREQVRMVQVATAAVNIEPRAVIQPGMVQFTEQPLDEAPAGAYSTTEAVYGKVAQQMIPAGSAITSTKVADRNTNLGMAFNLQDGRRAMSVALDPVSGVAGFLKPGDHVDVIATYSGNGEDVTRTVLQNVTLMAIGSTPINTAQYQNEGGPAIQKGDNPNKATVDAATATLAVWPDQAQILALASAKARLHLALRPVDDEAPTPLPPTDTGVVFGPMAKPVDRVASAPPPQGGIQVQEQPRYAPPPPPPAAPRVEPLRTPPPSPAPAPKEKEPGIVVIRGTQQSEVVVPE